jgi:hypothetical protein
VSQEKFGGKYEPCEKYRGEKQTLFKKNTLAGLVNYDRNQDVKEGNALFNYAPLI